MSRFSKTTPRQNRREARKTSRDQRREACQPVPQIQCPSFEDSFTRQPARKTQPLVPLTNVQADYGKRIDSSRISFGIGPAGTGKTYYATRLAAEKLEKGDIEKIYLTRPAVEAGERLGFLPGDLNEKYEPYLRPFKDALIDHFGQGHLEYLIRKGVIEPVPLGYLRGSTIKKAWMLADEMQNATKAQMKMLLTRLGKESVFVINGDPNQLDIPENTSGLMDAVNRLVRRKNIEGVSLTTFTRADVVRDDIVADVLEAYDD